MLSLGEQLYRLTSRDEETLLMDPVLRRYDVALNPGQLTGLGGIFPIPIDRCFYIHRITYEFNAFVGGNWTGYQMIAATTGSFSFYIDAADSGAIAAAAAPILQGTDYPAAPAVGSGLMITRQLEMLLPPGLNSLRLNLIRNNAVNAGSASAWIAGYFIPPGRIGRVG